MLLSEPLAALGPGALLPQAHVEPSARVPCWLLCPVLSIVISLLFTLEQIALEAWWANVCSESLPTAWRGGICARIRGAATAVFAAYVAHPTSTSLGRPCP